VPYHCGSLVALSPPFTPMVSGCAKPGIDRISNARRTRTHLRPSPILFQLHRGSGDSFLAAVAPTGQSRISPLSISGLTGKVGVGYASMRWPGRRKVRVRGAATQSLAPARRHPGRAPTIHTAELHSADNFRDRQQGSGQEVQQGRPPPSHSANTAKKRLTDLRCRCR
jgi:hypothetical protein